MWIARRCFNDGVMVLQPHWRNMVYRAQRTFQRENSIFHLLQLKLMILSLAYKFRRNFYVLVRLKWSKLKKSRRCSPTTRMRVANPTFTPEIWCATIHVVDEIEGRWVDADESIVLWTIDISKLIYMDRGKLK